MNSERWKWSEQRSKAAFLALEDGTILRGYSVGANKDAVGEVVFNTGMTGYQEILSDPSYHGQFVVMTYPEIGNTGINSDDMESERFYASGFLVREMNEASNWRSENSAMRSLEKNGIPAIAGIDTRYLTVKLREAGTLKGYISVESALTEQEAVTVARTWVGLDNQDYARKVSCKEVYRFDENGKVTCSWGMPETLPEPDLKVVAYDFGIKWNILRNLKLHGMDVTVVPGTTPAEEVLSMGPDGVFLSNGPADPAGVKYGIEAARQLVGRVPVMGICLGHQILGIATGGERFRLKFGHHGCNHPVRNMVSGRIEITSQNHNFCVKINKAKVQATHINLNDETVEGLRHRSEPMFAVQYHPEAGPGPHDPNYLFAEFRKLIEAA
ncbi:MAG: glutamine-hydrolyzing carbamoyl-phosphate synthase small subunit [Verrucomicrobiota bacterium]